MLMRSISDGSASATARRAAQDAVVEMLALEGRHGLRVAHAGDVPLGMENHRRRDDGAGQTARRRRRPRATNPTRRSAFSSVRIAGTRVIRH
jgi:hypothetical protein